MRRAYFQTIDAAYLFAHNIADAGKLRFGPQMVVGKNDTTGWVVFYT